MLVTSAISRKWEQSSSQLTCFGAKQLLFPHTFCEVQKAPKSTAAGAWPRTPLGSLQRFPRPPSWWGGRLAAPYSRTPPPPRPFGPQASALRTLLLRPPQFSTQIDATADISTLWSSPYVDCLMICEWMYAGSAGLQKHTRNTHTTSTAHDCVS